VTFENVVLDGRKKASVDVQLLHEDAALAIKVAKEIRRHLHLNQFGVLKAVDKAFDATGREIGAHDLVCDRPTEHAGPQGLYSVEVKLRQLYSEAGRKKVRQKLREESLPLFETALQNSRSGSWAGRVVLLVEFGRGSLQSWNAVRADLYLGGTWKTLFGWPGSQATLARPAVATSAPGRRPPPAPASDAASLPPMNYRRDSETNGKRVAPVRDLYTTGFMGSSNNVGRDCKRWLQARPGDVSEVFQAPRKKQKRGGKLEWQATERMLRLMFAQRVRP
jgi:hypothetical protein